jgi:hypothetical protein
MSASLTRATDSRGRPIRGIWTRDRKYYASVMLPDATGKRRSTYRLLDATNPTEARKAREKLLLDHAEGRQVARDGATFSDLFAEAGCSQPVRAHACPRAAPGQAPPERNREPTRAGRGRP